MNWTHLRSCALRALAPFAIAACVSTAQDALAVDLKQVSPTQWDATNGIISFSMNPQSFAIKQLSVTINGVTTNWMDGNYPSPFGHATELYDLYSYNNPTTSHGAVTSNFRLTDTYLDMWQTKAHIPGSDPLEIEIHWVIRDGDPGIHFYQVLRHTATDGPTSFGAATVNFFPSANAISRADGSTMLYQKDTGPNNLGVTTETFPSDAFTHNLLTANPGRQVQKETVDYSATGLGTFVSSPGLAREFITKYNYSEYAQYHVAQGFVGDTNAFWWVVNAPDTLIGGPTKQYLTSVQLEYQSAHFGGADTPFAAGEISNRLFGPFYLRFNALGSNGATADDLYVDAAGSVASSLDFYDHEDILIGDGYVPRANRGNVHAQLSNPQGWSADSAKNVVVLSDTGKDFQESSKAYQYWGYVSPQGTVDIANVVPGTYRLSAYSLGQWGTFHTDNVVIGTNTYRPFGLSFAPRNFSTQDPLWTIGTPDRSAHEFLHAHDAAGRDVRDYIGAFNYWADLAPNLGKVVYTIGASTPEDWPFVQYGAFYPNLFAGAYGGSNTVTNGYDFITPQYVKDGARLEGKTPATFNGPPWEIHFTTTADQIAQGAYALLSINLAASDHTSLQVRLNNTHRSTLLWYPRLGSDPEQRSGVAGYNNYAVFQFNTVDLNPPGEDNVITLYATGAALYDALKLEISPNSADPALSNWPEYDWMYYNNSGASTQQSASAP